MPATQRSGHSPRQRNARRAFSRFCTPPKLHSRPGCSSPHPSSCDNLTNNARTARNGGLSIQSGDRPAYRISADLGIRPTSRRAADFSLLEALEEAELQTAEQRSCGAVGTPDVAPKRSQGRRDGKGVNQQRVLREVAWLHSAGGRRRRRVLSSRRQLRACDRNGDNPAVCSVSRAAGARSDCSAVGAAIPRRSKVPRSPRSRRAGLWGVERALGRIAPAGDWACGGRTPR